MVHHQPKDNLKYKYDLDITFVHDGAHVAKLSRDNYPAWRSVIQGMMERANCWGIIQDKACATPNSHSSESFKHAFRVANDILVYSCSDSIKRAIDHCEHPRAMWLALEVQFHTSHHAIDCRRAINTGFKLSRPTPGIPISHWLRHLLRLQKLVMFSDMMILNDAVIAQIARNLPPGPYSNTFWTFKRAGRSPKRIIQAIHDRELRVRHMGTQAEEIRPWCSYHQQRDDHNTQECPVLKRRPVVELHKTGDTVAAARFRRTSTGNQMGPKMTDDLWVKPNDGRKIQGSQMAINQDVFRLKAPHSRSPADPNASKETSAKDSRREEQSYCTRAYDPASPRNSAPVQKFCSKGNGNAPRTPRKASTSTSHSAYPPKTPPPPKGYWGHKPPSYGLSTQGPVTPPHLRRVSRTAPEDQHEAHNISPLKEVPPIEELYIGHDGYMRRRGPSTNGTPQGTCVAPKAPFSKAPPATAPANTASGQGKSKGPEPQFVIGSDGWMRAVPAIPTTPSPLLEPPLATKTPPATVLRSESPNDFASSSTIHTPGLICDSKPQFRDGTMVSLCSPARPAQALSEAQKVPTSLRRGYTPPASLRMGQINAFCRWYDCARMRKDDNDEEEFAMAALSVAHDVMIREQWELEDIALFSQHDWDRHIEYHPAMMVMTRAIATYLTCLARGIINEEAEEE